MRCRKVTCAGLFKFEDCSVEVGLRTRTLLSHCQLGLPNIHMNSIIHVIVGLLYIPGRKLVICNNYPSCPSDPVPYLNLMLFETDSVYGANP